MANQTDVADAMPAIAKHCGSRGPQYLAVKNSPPCVTCHQTARKKGLHTAIALTMVPALASLVSILRWPILMPPSSYRSFASSCAEQWRRTSLYSCPSAIDGRAPRDD
jgi:hypothetical protein